jgi:hypothetical protein
MEYLDEEIKIALIKVLKEPEMLEFIRHRIEIIYGKPVKTVRAE